MQAYNRTGQLCSKCKDGFGLKIGNSDCSKCKTDVAIPLFVFGFLLLGIVLVVFLVAFDVTYTEGHFSCLLFYANIVHVKQIYFFLTGATELHSTPVADPGIWKGG